MNTEDRKLTLLAVAVAIGGSYLTKLALDELLRPGQPAYAREFEEAHARAYGLTKPAPGALSEALAASIALGISAWTLSQVSSWAFAQAGRG